MEQDQLNKEVENKQENKLGAGNEQGVPMSADIEIHQNRNLNGGFSNSPFQPNYPGQNKEDNDDDIVVQPHSKDNTQLPPESASVSIDRSGSMFMPKMSNVSKEVNYFANLNTLRTLTKKEKAEKEKEEEKQNFEANQRRFSETSHVSNLSAHKVVLRNGQKDLVCYTNEHRSEPDGEMFKGEIHNLSKGNEEEEKLSARDVASESGANDSSGDESKDVVNELGTPVKIERINKKRQSENSKASDSTSKRRDSDNVKKLSIKHKKRMSDFDEVTRDVNFKVYKQEKMQRETKVMITDLSIAPSKTHISDLSIKNKEDAAQKSPQNKEQPKPPLKKSPSRKKVK